MVIAGLVFAGIAAAIHVYIFILESLRWTDDKTRAVFGIESREVAETTRSMAFNQGFYNLFLAIEIAIGIVAYAMGSTTVGLTLVFVGTASMVAAGLVLMLSDRSKTSAALKQLVPPLLAIILLVIGTV